LTSVSDQRALSAGDLAIVIFGGLSATSGPGNNIDCFQALEKNHRQKSAKKAASPFHFDRSGDQALVSPED
jgi:hypothetical protein